ncbi:metalloregulator ArsR/SmtB family transcription factor [Asticcacaulis sp. AC402]|uniref:ArsR/SmtB family transcription factor n=1 Tax=Asticcacaulis sp. AC402 TaxID=1282361 RepID=UPI0003C3D140|nr:metalloregulator ArsR/SmtB family transcription factor [Asticcacaulis sp. AC402]ESQ76055.1 ArsR family transcriptional regulator [Asticcacaulis sp. AC402]
MSSAYPLLADFDGLLDALKAAGEATRLRLLRLLAREELSVMELVSILGQSQPRISRHLKLMTEAGLIERFPDGAWVFYRLSSAPAVQPLVETILRLMGDAHAGDLRQLEAVRGARRASAESYFETIAPQWDEIRSHYIAESDVEAVVVELARQQPYQHLVDLGTGSGRMLTLLAAQARTAIGVDLSQHMLNLARARTHEAGLESVEFRHGDIGDTRLPAACADLIVVHQVLHFLGDPRQAVAEAARLLKPGGRLLIVDFAHHELEIMREKYNHRRLGIAESDMNAWLKSAALIAGSISHMKPEKPGGLTVTIWTCLKIATP